MKPQTTYMLVVISALFWGMNFALAGPILQDISPLWLAAFRFTLSALIMIILTLWRGEPLLVPAQRHFRTYLVVGTIGIGGFNLLFFYAMQTLSAGNASLIMATNPLLTTLLAVLVLGEKFSRRLLLSIPLALIGVIIVVSFGKSSTNLTGLSAIRGELLMLGANLAWAGYNVLSRKLMPKQSSLTNTTLVMSAGALMLMVAAVLNGQHVTVLGLQATVDLTIMIIGGTIVAYLCWNTGIARLGAGRTSLFLNLVPVFAMLTAAAMGNLPNIAQIIGGMLVISGVILAMLK